MQEEYKGFIIKFSELNFEFTVRIGDSDYKNKELEKVRKRIDDLDKKDFKRFDVIIKYHSYRTGEQWKTYTVTSVFFENGWHAWVVDDQKGRSKQRYENLYEATEENKNKIKLMADVQAKIDLLGQEKDGIEKTMTRQVAPKTEEAT
jgi:hypothetical protein